MDVDTAGRIGDALPALLSVGVQTWGTDVTALGRSVSGWKRRTEYLPGVTSLRPGVSESPEPPHGPRSVESVRLFGAA